MRPSKRSLSQVASPSLFRRGRSVHQAAFLRGLLLFVGVVVLLACDKRQEQLDELGIDEAKAKRILAEMSAKAAAARPPKRKKPKSTGGRGVKAPVVNQDQDFRQAAERWVVDGLVDVAPAAPSTVNRHGVFMLDGRNRLWLAKRGRLGKGKKPLESPIRAIPDNPEKFPLGRGPSIAGDYAYWVTNHFLLRRPVVPPYEPLETLADDARLGTRVSALTAFIGGKKRTWVSYIALPSAPGGPLRAKLWHGTDRHIVLTEEASSALSVQLILAGDGAQAIMLEARTGMTTIHMRRVSAGPELPVLDEDHVLWVGGSSHPMTEVHALKAGAKLFALLPIEQDVSHFGMAVLDLSTAPEPATVNWMTYANGLDPAPVDSARVCDVSAVLFVRPSTPEPGAPQELVLAELRAGIPQEGLILGRSKAFYDVSIAPLEGGALLSYVADYRTWARTVRCL